MATVHFTTITLFTNKLKLLAGNHNIEFGDEEVEVLTRRLESGYEAIAGVLMSRGLTEAQISTWRRGEEFQLDIATYWYAKDNGWGGKNEDEKDWTLVFNRIKELEACAIINNDGEIILVSTKDKGFAKGINALDVHKRLGIYP